MGYTEVLESEVVGYTEVLESEVVGYTEVLESEVESAEVLRLLVRDSKP